MGNKTDDEADAKESNRYHPVEGNALDGYRRDYYRDLDDPMRPSPGMALLGLFILYFIAALVVANIVLSD